MFAATGSFEGAIECTGRLFELTDKFFSEGIDCVAVTLVSLGDFIS